MGVRINLNRRWPFYALFYALLGLVFVKYVLMISVPQIVLLALIGLIAFLGEKDEIITICLIGIPLYSIVQIYYVVFICLSIYVLKYHRQMSVNYGLAPVLALWGWELIHCLVGDYINNASIIFILPYLFCVVIMYNCSNDIDYGFVTRNYAVCTLWMCITVLCKSMIYTGLSVANIFSAIGRFGYTNIEGTEAFINPNTLGFLCIFASIFLIQLIVSKRGTRLDIFMTVLLLFFGALTMSFTFFVCALAMICLFLMVVFKNRRERMKFIATVLSIMLIGVLCLQYFFPIIWETFINRFLVEDISNGRIALLLEYNEYIFSSIPALLFGTGIALNYNLTENYFDSVSMQVPHNGIQELLVVWGIPGLVLFISFIIWIVRCEKRTFEKRNLLNYIPLLMILLKVQAGQLATSHHTILMLSLAYLSLCMNFNKKEHIEI